MSTDPLKEKSLHPLAQLERDFLQVARDLNGGEYATLITHSLLPIAHRIVEAALAAHSAAPIEREALPVGNNARYDGLAGNAKWIKESATFSQVEDILRQRAGLFAELKKLRGAAARDAAKDEGGWGAGTSSTMTDAQKAAYISEQLGLDAAKEPK